jgi:hypothetical protein
VPRFRIDIVRVGLDTPSVIMCVALCASVRMQFGEWCVTSPRVYFLVLHLCVRQQSSIWFGPPSWPRAATWGWRRAVVLSSLWDGFKCLLMFVINIILWVLFEYNSRAIIDCVLNPIECGVRPGSFFLSALVYAPNVCSCIIFGNAWFVREQWRWISLGVGHAPLSSATKNLRCPPQDL